MNRNVKKETQIFMIFINLNDMHETDFRLIIENVSAVVV